jgi:hypothetical protein
MTAIARVIPAAAGPTGMLQDWAVSTSSLRREVVGWGPKLEVSETRSFCTLYPEEGLSHGNLLVRSARGERIR